MTSVSLRAGDEGGEMLIPPRPSPARPHARGEAQLPSVTTCSPAASPCSTTTSWPNGLPYADRREATVPSGCTTKTNFPS